MYRLRYLRANNTVYLLLHQVAFAHLDYCRSRVVPRTGAKCDHENQASTKCLAPHSREVSPIWQRYVCVHSLGVRARTRATLDKRDQPSL